MHFCALFALFHAFSFRSMLVCLDLGLCHVLVCFPFVGLCLLVFRALLFVWLHPLPFCDCLDATTYGRVHLCDVGLLATCLYLLFLAWHVRVSCVSLLVLYNMFSSPLCVNMLGYHCACFVPSCLTFFVLFASLLCSCMCLCVPVCVIKLSF